MSYQLKIKPTVEYAESHLNDKLTFFLDSVEIIKTELLTFCMLEHQAEDLQTVLYKIQAYLDKLYTLTLTSTKRSMYDSFKTSEDGSITLYGWRYAKSDDDFYETEFKMSTLRNLLMFAIIVKTPDYYSEDGEKFHKKFYDILEEINEYIDSCKIAVNWSIIKEFDEFIEKDECSLESLKTINEDE